MSAGSGASNLGYGNVAPLSHINGSYVNVDNSQYAGRFGSNEIPGTPPGPLPGLAGTKSNIDAAAGIYPGTRSFNGGAKKLKRKIKNITKQYRMKGKSLRKRISTLRRKLKNRFKRSSKSRSSSRRYRQKGGYSQYQNNAPISTNYSTGGYLKPMNSALANPVPYKILSNNVNCVDNYNHYTNKGFASRGH